MNPPLLCNACLAVIGHGHLAEHGDSIGGWVERVEHECAPQISHNTRRAL